jgi:outer membrane biosynthesis protein TonB
MSENTQPTTTNNALALTSLDDIDRVAGTIAQSGMFGMSKKEQAATLLMICMAEGRHPIAALKRYHIIDGRPSMRADAMQGDFQAWGGKIIWHSRTDAMVAATFIDKETKLDAALEKRAVERFKLAWRLSFLAPDAKEYSATVDKMAELSRAGEETIIRTFADAEAKGLAVGKYGIKDNWRQSPRQMLTARTITEGIRLMAPGIIAGMLEEGEAQDLKDERLARPRTAAELEVEIKRLQERAMGETGNERSATLGLAGDLRAELDNLTPAPTQTEPPKTIEKAPEPAKSDTATKAEEKAPETPAVPTKPAKAKKTEPAKAAEAQPELPQHSAPDEPVTQEAEVVNEAAPTNEDPYAHKLMGMKHKDYEGKTLGNLDPKLIVQAHEKWALKPEKQALLKKSDLTELETAQVADMKAIAAVYPAMKKALEAK